MNAKQQMQLPMMDLALDWIEPDPVERYRLHPEGQRAITLSIEALLDSGAPPQDGLLDLLRLSEVFRREHGAMLAANGILSAICASPRALALLGVRGEREGDFASFIGGGGRRAPKVGEAAPEGSVKATHFLSPTKRFRR